MARDYEQELDANLKDLVERLKGKRIVPGRCDATISRRWMASSARWEFRWWRTSCYRPGGHDIGSHLRADFYGELRVPARDGVRDAVQALGFNLQYGSFGYVVEADIQGFFSHLDHGWLKRMLRERIADESFIGLIGQWLKAGVLEPDGSFLYPEAGTPQGGVVSPILANIYLHHGLDLWFEAVVKPHCRGKALLIRYADDFRMRLPVP